MQPGPGNMYRIYTQKMVSYREELQKLKVITKEAQQRVSNRDFQLFNCYIPFKISLRSEMIKIQTMVCINFQLRSLI